MMASREVVYAAQNYCDRTTAADPITNPDAYYAAQDDEIAILMNTDPDDSSALLEKLYKALADPFLPQRYRAEYSIRRADFEGGQTATLIRAAKVALEGVRNSNRLKGYPEDHDETFLTQMAMLIEIVEACAGKSMQIMLAESVLTLRL